MGLVSGTGERDRECIVPIILKSNIIHNCSMIFQEMT